MCRVHGEPELLTVEDVPEPVVEAGEVTVRVAAAAVNFPDVLVIADKYQVSIPPPFVPGSEFAGVVESVGDGVSDLQPGDPVFGSMMAGAFAEVVRAPASSVARLPSGVELTDAAAFRVAYATAYHSLRTVAEVRGGETVLVLGAAGGVGLAAVESAKLLGARVIAAASSPEKLEVCIGRGADHVIDYRQADLRDELRRIAPDGVQVVIDPVGGSASEQALRALSAGGRFVVVGFASGEIPRLPANLILLKNARVCGYEARTFARLHAADKAYNDAEMLAHLAAGRLRPYISATFGLADAAAALRWVADRKATGKVVLVV